MDGQAPRKKTFTRRLLWALGLLLVLGVVAAAALPWALSTPPARDAAVKAVNRALAPSTVGVGGLSVSWAGPIRLTALTLRDGKGKTLVEADEAMIDRGLFSLLRDRSHLGTITLLGAKIDVERRADGSIDLADALRPAKDQAGAPGAPAPTAAPPTAAAPARATAETDVTLKVVRGSLVLRSPELAEPIRAGQLDMEVNLPAAAGKRLNWNIRLANPAGGSAAETLAIDGEYDHRAEANADLAVEIKGERWPLAATASGVVARGQFVGALKAARASGQWATSGEAKLLGLDASGPPLAGDRLAFGVLRAGWDLAETADAWSVRRLGVVCPVGTLSASGSVAGAGAKAIPDVRIDGKIDLAALSKQLPHALHLREGLTLEHGSARVVLQVKTEGEAQHGTVEANVSDLVARDPKHAFTLRDPAAVTAQATRTAAGVSVQTVAVKTAFLTLNGSGDLARGVKLAGTIDLGGLEAQFRDLIDFGAVALAGKGRLAADYRKVESPKSGTTYVGRFATELHALHVAGLTAEPVVRDAVRFDLAASGSAEATGMPRSWENLRANLKSSQDNVAIAALNRDGKVGLNGVASIPLALIPVTLSQHDGQAEMKLVGRWRPGPTPGQGMVQGAVDLDELRLTLRPADPALAAAGTISFAGKGGIDLDGDDLALTPLPLPAGVVTPLVLAPEGLKVHGLRKTPLAERAARGGFLGDLAAIEQALFVWKGREPGGLGGALTATIGMGAGDAGKLNLALTASVPDLSRPGPDGKGRQFEGPVSLAYSGAYDPDGDRLLVNALAASTRLARLDARGTIDAPTGRRVADLQGALTPNWEAVSAMAAAMTEPKTRLTGNPRAFRVKGPLSGDSMAAVLKGLDADLGVELTSASAFGMRLGPAPLVVHCKSGVFGVDPIQTTLNNGKVVLKPELTVDDAGAITVRLDPGSAVAGAEINDEVSKRVLSYVAPVLDEATHVNGKVSVTLDNAVFPITGPDDRTTSLTGQVVFQDVVFAPGPFAGQMLALVGKGDAPGLRLHQPIQLAIANRRVLQKGLNIPIAPDASIAMEGSVGFDETLDLRASLPITKGMLGANTGLNDLVGDQRVTVPIGGTVKQPKINRQALQVAIRDLSRNVLKRELSKEASGLLDKLGPPGARGSAGPGLPGGIPTDAKGLEDALMRRVLPRRR